MQKSFCERILNLMIGAMLMQGSLAGAEALQCVSIFKEETPALTKRISTNPFRKLTDPVVPSLYINRELISRNQWIRLEGKNFIIRDWYPSAGGDVLILESRKGKRKIVNAREFKKDLVVIDFVRLEELLSYKNERVINRFIRDHHVSREFAEEIFSELMKWFFLMHRYYAEGIHLKERANAFELGMYNETHRIDEMWHEFLLFSIDYTQFGHKYLGYYQHHQPYDHVETRSRAEIASDRQLMYQFIRATLGQETVEKWFTEQRYADPRKPVIFTIPPQMQKDL